MKTSIGQRDCLTLRASLAQTGCTKFQFTDASVPKAYDEYLVPRLFEPWSRSS